MHSFRFFFFVPLSFLLLYIPFYAIQKPPYHHNLPLKSSLFISLHTAQAKATHLAPLFSGIATLTLLAPSPQINSTPSTFLACQKKNLHKITAYVSFHCDCDCMLVIFRGLDYYNPTNGAAIPIWVPDYVLGRWL
ncbi:uncharacterized protein LOC130721083 isoform X2 [Lotus japonicus]|uniref:uncharacterized protein LOC130721083 isoform X2 n=1 Tax=Lotus japonicus TaxID=34305 RepID=UPI00258481A8|nr:uncharacterized protein LOC130721083 isoform X2 [Lotus japonicus]